MITVCIYTHCCLYLQNTMGIFDIFKKKPNYDPTNIKVTDLNNGFVFDYDLVTWSVEETYEYDWGNNFFTKEHKITNGLDSFFLSVEYDDEIKLHITSKINVRTLGNDIPEIIKETEEPPVEIIYERESYFLKSGNPGYIRNVNREDWDELMSWEYTNKTEDRVICIEQYDDDEFEAAVGRIAKEFEISNILPK